MSQGGDRLDAEKVFRNAIDQIRAFGYVDRNWVLSAYAAFYRKHQERTARKDDKKPGFWARIGKALGSIFTGPPREPDRFTYLNQSREGRDSLRLLQALLAHAPSPAPSLQGQRAPRRAPHKRSLADIIARADDDQLQLVAQFLRKSGLEETGFPVRLIGEKGEGAEPADGTEGGAAIDRNAALSTLTGGLLYRFAYDHDKKLKWEDTRKVFRASGLYRVYVVPPNSGYVERRLLMVRLAEDGAIVRAAEIRKPRDRFVVRGGYVIPASGINTFVLSSDFSPEVLARMIEEEISPAARDQVFPDGPPAEVQTSASFLQEHQLGFYSLFSRGEGELRGAVLEGPTPAAAVGYLVDPSEINLSAALPAPHAIDAIADTAESVRPRPPELGFLEFEEIHDRRDQILIAAVGRNPAVSIDIA